MIGPTGYVRKMFQPRGPSGKEHPLQDERIARGGAERRVVEHAAAETVGLRSGAQVGACHREKRRGVVRVVRLHAAFSPARQPTAAAGGPRG